MHLNSAFAQSQHTDSLNIIVAEIANSNVYETSYTVGYSGTVSAQYIRFKQLLQFSSVEQLIELARIHANEVVRLYAYQALKYKRTAIPEELTAAFMNDESLVKTLQGCFGGVSKLNTLASHKLTFLTWQTH